MTTQTHYDEKKTAQLHIKVSPELYTDIKKYLKGKGARISRRAMIQEINRLKAAENGG